MSESKQKLTLKGGTCVQVEGHEAYLAGDTDVETSSKDFDALRPHSTTPYQEYPKMLADGRIVQGPEDEKPKEPEPDLVKAEQADLDAKAAAAKKSPLDDVDVQMDNDDYHEKPKKPAAPSSHGGAKKK